MCMTWPTGRIRSLWDQISLEKGEALARSTFSVFRTDMKGQSDLFAVGPL
jgi:hypothetical protein